MKKDNTNYIFIGKTTCRRLSAVYSNHINGRISATASYFDTDNRPSIHILSEHSLTTAEAYKYTLAYIYLFQLAGYFCINHEGTLNHAQNPKPETLAIIQSLESEPVEDLLRKTLIPRAADADRKSPQKAQPCKPPIQMNVRIKPEDKLQFDSFRKQHHLNQQEAFSLLLDQANDKHYSDLLSKKDATIQKLQKENSILQEKLELQKHIPTPKPEQHAREFLHFAKEGISLYESLLPVPQPQKPLPRHSYRFFTRKLSDGIAYEYPTEEGYSILVLEKVLWSNNRTRACFLLGITIDGLRTRLRYYPSEYHLSCSFLDSKHAYPGAQWLVGYRFAKNLAMELVIALPLGCYPNPYSESTEPTSVLQMKEKRKLSLDDQIKQASSEK